MTPPKKNIPIEFVRMAWVLHWLSYPCSIQWYRRFHDLKDGEIMTLIYSNEHENQRDQENEIQKILIGKIK